MAKNKSGKYSKSKGNRYELKIINEIKELGFESAVSSRSESKSHDDAGIDIVCPELPVYVQCKATQNTPDYAELIKECKKKDKPLVIFHNKQKKVEKNCKSLGEYVIMDKETFYDLVLK